MKGIIMNFRKENNDLHVIDNTKKKKIISGVIYGSRKKFFSLKSSWCLTPRSTQNYYYHIVNRNRHE